MSDDFDKDGYLNKRTGHSKDRPKFSQKWKTYYVNLIGGSLHYYADAEVILYFK